MLPARLFNIETNSTYTKLIPIKNVLLTDTVLKALFSISVITKSRNLLVMKFDLLSISDYKNYDIRFTLNEPVFTDNTRHGNVLFDSVTLVDDVAENVAGATTQNELS